MEAGTEAGWVQEAQRGKDSGIDAGWSILLSKKALCQTFQTQYCHTLGFC